MPASAAQVFGPITIDPGFTTTGEKTLLTMNTTLPADGKNVIIVVFGKNSAFDTLATGTYRIYKGATLLYESKITEYFNNSGMKAKHVMLIAVDDAPAGNDSYSFRINITTAGTTTGSVHVQGIIIKTDDASWAYNTEAVSIAAGATATVTSMTTAFPANSKVALVAVVYGSWIGGGHQLIGAGNVKLKAGTTVVASNQFNIGSYQLSEPLWVSLAYLDTPTATSQTYSVEVTNGSSQTFSFYAEIVAFTVFNGAFLDTASVVLASGSQVTVGSLNTTLAGDIVAIGFAAAENTWALNVTAFNAGDVVLQLNNSATGQIANLTGWFLERLAYSGASGILPLFRIDTNVTNPSYQIKMTARAAGINGEAKILAFTLPVLVAVTDSGTGIEDVSVSVIAADSATGFDVVDMVKEAPDIGAGTEEALLSVPIDDSGAGSDVIGVSAYGFADDTGTGADDVLLSVVSDDSGLGSETVDVSSTVLVDDAGTGYDFITGGFFFLFDDSGTGTDEIVLAKEVPDSGVAVELVGMSKEALDAGAGLETVGSPVFWQLSDSGAGVELPTITVPQFDAGAGIELVETSKEVLDTATAVELVNMGIESIDVGVAVESVNTAKESIDSGVGFEAVGMAKGVLDAGAGADVVNMVKEALDAGAGVDAVLFVSREVRDTGTAVELPTAITSIPVLDSGTGFDVVGIIATIPAIDAGAGVEEATRTLSMFGDVTIDEIEIIGLHSIPYNDLVRDGLPIQVQRNATTDFVYIDSDQVGDVLVEWEDRVADVYRGRRTITVMGLVRIVD